MPAIGRSSARLPAPRRIAAVELLAERLEALHRLGLQPAIGQFLDAVGQPAFEEAPVVGRRLGLEEIAPLLLQLRRSASSSGPPAGPERCRSIQASCLREGVGMTALVGGTVERTFSGGRQIKDWTVGPAAA